MRSMAFKLVAAFAVVALVGVLIVAFLANRLTSTAFGSYVEQGVLAQDQRIADYIVGQYAAGGWRSVAATLMPISHSTGTRLVVADPSGKVVADSSGRLTNAAVPTPVPGRQVPLKADGKPLGTLYVAESTSGMSGMMGQWDMMDEGDTADSCGTTDERSMMGGQGMMGDQGWRGWMEGRSPASPGASTPTSPPNPTPPSSVANSGAANTSASNTSSAERYLEAVGQATWIAGGLAVLVAVLLGFFLSRRITLPLSRLTFAAGRVASGDFSQRVEVRSKDELASLADAFNTMAASLAKAEEQRRRLFSDIAHELKTPIAVIQGNLEAIADGVADPTPERISSLQEETALLTRLVTDLRDLSLAESGQLKLHPQPTDLGELVKGAAAGLQAQAEERGVEVAASAEQGLPPVLADPDRVGQVLRNLIANALRYTPSGGTIRVAATLDGQAGSSVRRARFAQVSVADTGSGIPAEDLPHIFDRFYRVDKSRSRASGGTGLGLAVVKQLVESHGGRVWAESELGKGTVFHFTLPTASPVRTV
ncbi:MAG: ATP-binding protein [Bacteroidetes bacterium]|nr:ATP-binding protein [Bacteroidota bacterium]